MRLLLDSHVVLWWLGDDERLSVAARERIATADDVFVSAVTPWELGIKKALGKISYPDDLVTRIQATGFQLLAIDAGHASMAPTLPPFHRDPFDRMLVAQATAERLAVVTADAQVAAYDVEVVAAS